MASAHQHEAGDGRVRSGLLFSDADRSRAAGSSKSTDLGLYRHLSNKMTGVDEAKTGPSASTTQDETSAKGAKGSRSFKALPEAPSGRPYTTWKLASGEEIALLGALFPDNYQLNPDPQLPWVCPVRSCRALYSKRQGVDIHFCRSHEAEMFNDNLDGTLSSVGRRTGIALPAIVVSQRRQPLDSGGASMREPSLPPPYLPSRTNTQGLLAAPSASSSRPEPLKPAQAAVLPPPDRRPSDRRSPTLDFETIGARSLWKHIKPHLDRLPLRIRHDSTGGFLWKLLEMPKLRGLHIEPEAADTFRATTEFDIPSLALYLTGVEAPYPCFRCLCGKGPFKGCIIVHPEAPDDVRNALRCCACCYYKGHGDSCGLDASLIHGQQTPGMATSTEELSGPQTSNEPPILEEGTTDTRHHERPTPLLPKQTPAPGGPDEPTRLEAKSFGELAVECFVSQLKNDKNGKTALLSATEITPGESSNSATSNASAQPSQCHTNEAVPDCSTSVPEEEPGTPPPVTPSRRSTRLVQKSSARASSPPPAPKTPAGRKQLTVRIPETPPSRSAQQHHGRVQEQDPDLSPVSTTRRSERLRTRTPATPSRPGGLRSPIASTEKRSSAGKRKLEEVENDSGGAATNMARFKRREVHLGSFNQASSSGSSVSSTMAPPTPVSAVSPQHRCRDVLELEDWEIAPGRVRSGKHNIAFSTAHLRTAKPVPVHPGIGFHIVTLHPGTTFGLEPLSDKIRIVSIAKGKVRLRISDADGVELTVNADGAVKVPPDTACVLENRLSTGATLHVCCLQQHQRT
ncbi:hypothetical protein DL766_002797 [Monosporascus sp. MC13-8B]|nr:hypothetical protein DL766_002797 [Monosporascus sp. MC13-8B]